MFTLSQIRHALASRQPVQLQSASNLKGRAAVALIFSGPPETPSLCFIQRAIRRNDPWSGHMAFPGGRVEPQDTTPRSIAERETEEEVGFSLNGSELLGALSELWIRHSGIVTDKVLTPFVYYTGIEHPTLTGSEEVAEGYWIPVKELWAQENQTTIEYERKGQKVVLPGIRYEQQIIWGLTYMMLCSLGEMVGAPLPAPEPENL